MRKTLTAFVASLLIVVAFIPSAVLVGPARAHAQLAGADAVAVPTAGWGFTDVTTMVKSAYTSIQAALTQVNTYTTMVASYAQLVNTYVLQPLAFVMSGQLMKALTASVMKFVIGKANGTGIPQFAVDVQKSLRSISDFQKNAYLRQVSLTNSPFATSIAQALGTDYNQKTSLAGYWAANMNTLGRNIPTYRPGYLSGNWSQGGTAAWFQLTTQTQNNPYILYQSSQSQLQTLVGNGVGGSSGARLAQLQWGQGFMSWCGTSDAASQKADSAKTAQDFCIAEGGSPSYCDKVYSDYRGETNSINPGDACTDKDGNPGNIQTPGSVISATLNKVLGGQQDKLVQMGNISAQVNQILGNIGTVLNTINLAANILGGGSTGGLLNAGQPSGALTRIDTPVAVSDSQRAGLTSGYGTSETGIQDSFNNSETVAAKNTSTTSAVAAIPSYNDGLALINNASDGAISSGMPGRVQQYQTAWNAIASVASTTASSLRSVMDACHTYWNGNSQYENNAQNAISFEVTPILTQAAGIQAIADAALSQDALVNKEATTTSTYAADLQKLNTMTPTASDVTTAQYNATAYGGAKANPAGSLTVSGGSIVDQMNLIRNNAAAMETAYCTAQSNGY